MLKHWFDNKNQDYLDQLRPFVTHVLPGVGEIANPSKVATSVSAEFGLFVPVLVVERMFGRLQRSGVLLRQDGAWYVKTMVKDNDLERRRQDAAEDIASVVAEFKEHCLRLFEIDVTDEEAAIALVGFVRRFSVECLRSFTRSSALPRIISSAKEDVWVGSFISEAHKLDSSLWKEIRTLFGSVLLTNAFICPEPDMVTTKFRTVYFFLDTSLIISLLGLHGETDARKVTELLKLIKRLEGSVFVFEHTLDETRAVLKYVETNFNSSSSLNRVIRQLRDDGRGRSDVVLISATLEERLKVAGVRIRTTPNYDERYQIDEKELEGCLDDDIGHLNEKALLHDINSVRSIYVLRSGSRPRKIEDSKAVFVTSNFKFAKAADVYSRRFEFSRDVSPVVTDFALANICWLKSPAHADELLTLELLASAEAAFSPSSDEWQAVLKECERLRREGVITTDQETLVRENLVSRDDYVSLTTGAGNDFDSGVALEIVRRAEERVSAPLRNELDERKRQLLDADNVLKVEREQALLRAKLQAEKIDKLSEGASWIICSILLALIVWGTFVGVKSSLSGVPLMSIFWLDKIVGVLIPFIVMILGWFGMDYGNINERLKLFISSKIKKILIVPF
ncbi:hypothetical protein [Lysobacter capsici]|uniref:hypothetical protein n=1 Tax=Lysobacter capsici TaxID=435897 RepID=UPI0011DFA694|nr:hypothetical protein [Lysobacter capsici]